MPDAKTRRIGLLGGTFDPPHQGHVAAALAVLHELTLDEVRLVVAHDPWQKSAKRNVSPAHVRLEMTRELVKNVSGLTVDDSEIQRGGQTFTSETLEDLRRKEPDAEIFLIVGADTAARIHTWNRPETVLALSTLVVVNRGTSTVELPEISEAHIVHVHMKPVDIASSDIRVKVRAGESVASLTNDAVQHIIQAQHLYEVKK